jgi:hypothetical protein
LERHPVKKEERMGLLHLLRNMGRRYNVSKSSGKHSMYTKEYAKYDKLKEKLSTKIDETLSNLKNSEWIRLIPPTQEEKQDKYKSDYIQLQPLTERLKPIIDSVKNNTLSMEQYQALATQINLSIKTAEEIKTDIAEFQAKMNSKSRGISY